MKIGICGGVECAPLIKSLGYDFIEEGLMSLAMLSEKEFEERMRVYEQLELPVYSFNQFFGSEISLYEKNSLVEIERYAKKALLRAHRLGGKLCIIGSGAARNIPDGVLREFAEKRFCDILSVCADIGEAYGIQIVVEPLNGRETNYINTVGDAASVAQKTGRNNVGAMVDFFHFFIENEKDDQLIQNTELMFHAHIARPNRDRRVPREEDLPVVSHWADLLKRSGYRGAIALEAKFVDFENEIREFTKCMRLFC